MATSNRGRGGRNNNPKGRNQYSGMIGTARANPLSTVAALGGAVAAGLLLWSRRNQISDEIGNLADRVNGWREADDTAPEFVASADTSSRGDGRTQAEIAEEALTLKQTGEVASAPSI